MHDSESALDWSEYYYGESPCASCLGIRTSITLNENGLLLGKKKIALKNKN